MSKKPNIGKRFKTISRKNATTLTFGEKTSGISATDAVTKLLDRSDNKSDESFYDIISAFSNQAKHPQQRRTSHRIKHKSKRQQRRTSHRGKKTENIEYVNKETPIIKKKPKQIKLPLRTLNDDDDLHQLMDIALESSSNCNNTQEITSINESNDALNITEPPKKKQKRSKQLPKYIRNAINTTETDYYTEHWNTRYSSRNFDIYPLIKQRRSTRMKVMDIDHRNYCCFIDRDCDEFEVSHDIRSIPLQIHNNVITAYNIRKEKWLKSSKKWIKNADNNPSYITSTESVLLSAMRSYRDLLFCDRNWKNDENIKHLMTMHILSHILCKRDIETENNLKLRRNEFIPNEDNDGLIRDSGFKRLSVLIITPFRENVRKFGCCILENLPKERTFINTRYKKFMEEYGVDDDKTPKGRGKDYQKTFFGNIDDDFWCGMSIDAKGVNFLQNWYYSDIILISPLRLKLIFDRGVTSDGRSVFDFFSSIEIMIIDQMDIIEMQNIQHLFDTLHKINWHPKLKKEDDLSALDFNRLRYCYIDDVAQYYRQNIFITKHQTPKIKQLFEQRGLNLFGRVKIQQKMDNECGILHKVIPHVKQHFYRFELKDDDVDINEFRLQMYEKYMLPIFRGTQCMKTLIFVSSYFDFLRLRKLYQNVKNMRFLSEYTIRSDENKYRRQFGDENNENVVYLVVTERYYFYKRIKCEGAQRVIFYTLPQNKEYYYEILNWCNTKNQYVSYALYAKNYDNLALQRIVGLKRMIKMLKHQNRTQIFI